MGEVIKSKHSQLFVAVAAAEVIKVTRLCPVDFPDGQASEIDISDYDDWGQFVAGCKQTGGTGIEIIYGSVGHEKLEKPHGTGDVVNWIVTATEGVTKPSAAAGKITPPDKGRSTAAFPCKRCGTSSASCAHLSEGGRAQVRAAAMDALLRLVRRLCAPVMAASVRGIGGVASAGAVGYPLIYPHRLMD